jgi:hypothetical protein
VLGRTSFTLRMLVPLELMWRLSVRPQASFCRKSKDNNELDTFVG